MIGGAWPIDLPRLLDGAESALILLNRAGRPQLLNEAARRLCQRETGAATLLRVVRAAFPQAADRRLALEAIRLVLSGATSHARVEASAQGGRESLRVALGGVRDAAGGVAGALLVATEMGELRVLNAQLEQYAANLEEMVYERTRELARSEQKYRELFDASPDLYVMITAAGRVEEVNRTALRLTGRRREEVVGRRALRFLTPASRRAVSTALPAFFEHGGLQNLELHVPRRNGPPLSVFASAAPVRNDDGTFAGARVVLRDITHRAMLERQLSQAERLAATGRLAAGVAHEINNPLQAVLTHLSLVESQLGDDFAERESWSRVGEAIKRIQQIVTDLLDLHRGADGEVGPVDVNRVVQEALGLVQTPLRHRGLAAHVDLAPDLPALTTVGRHLYQIVLNLVLNAMEAMPRGGTVTVRTRRTGGGSEVEIDVADTGPGIPEELLAHIFDPFLTSAGRRGTGLGLFVTYGLVRQHGGRIQVDSTPGRGSTFRVFFPAEARQNHQGRSKSETHTGRR